MNQYNLNLELKPKLIPSILAGFDTVANHIHLIIIPIILDIFLWFGPRIRIKDLALPFINGLSLPAELQNNGLQGIFASTREVYILLVERFSIFSAFHTLPVGIPSLINSISPITNPIGTPLFIEAKNVSSAIMMWLVIGLVGLIITSFYYNMINRSVNAEKNRISPGSIGWQTLQLLYLMVICVVFLLLLVFPALMLVSFLSLISPVIGQIAMFIGGLILIWIITPMLFTPQGIFIQHQSVLKALLASVRMVRFALPSTGLFFLVLFIIAQGLDLLWLIPGENSWFTLIGIAGHALVNTSLLAGIFIYYRDGVKWIQSIIIKNNLTQSPFPENPKDL